MQSRDRLHGSEIRKVICSANAIESLNARLPVRSGPAATFRTSSGIKVPVSGRPVPRPDRHRPDQMGHAMEAGDNAFAITFGDRFPAAGTC